MQANTDAAAPTDETAGGPWPKPAYAWYVVILITIAYAFAILDRIAIGLLVDPIKTHLGVSDTQIGLLEGLAFAICYTTFGLPAGFLADRWSRKKLLAGGIAVWSAATMACGMASSFMHLFFARLFVGVGEATVTPCSSSLISDYFPPSVRSKAFGVFMLGSSLGTGMSYVMAGAAIHTAALLAGGSSWFAQLPVWQLTFLMIGAPGLLVSIIFLLTVKEPVRRGKIAAPVAGKAQLGPLLKALRANRAAYVALLVGPVINVTAVYANLGWQPSLFIRVHEWTAPQVAVAMASIALPIGMSGALIAGWTLAFLIKRGRKDAPILMTMGQSISLIVFSASAALAPTPQIALMFMAFGAVASTWSFTSALTGLNQITPNELRGQVTAVYTLGTGLVSMTAGTFLVGFLNDNVFPGPKQIGSSLATVYASCGFLGAIVLLSGRKAFVAAVERAQTWQERS